MARWWMARLAGRPRHLSKDGFHVTIVQEPLTASPEDIEATSASLINKEGPVVLVGPQLWRS